VLLKGVERGGFVFYTNYRSRKAASSTRAPAACLVFLWPDLERQVRVEGSVEKLSAGNRTPTSRPGRWAPGSRPGSAQSERVPDRATLEAAMEEARRRHGERPPGRRTGRLPVMPQSIEFWQGRADRLHDRLLYTRGGGGWRIERLAP